MLLHLTITTCEIDQSLNLLRHYVIPVIGTDYWTSLPLPFPAVFIIKSHGVSICSLPSKTKNWFLISIRYWAASIIVILLFVARVWIVSSSFTELKIGLDFALLLWLSKNFSYHLQYKVSLSPFPPRFLLLYVHYHNLDDSFVSLYFVYPCSPLCLWHLLLKNPHLPILSEMRSDW